MLKGTVTEVDLKGLKIAFTVGSDDYVMQLVEGELGNTVDKLNLIKPGMGLGTHLNLNSRDTVASLEIHFLSYENTSKFSRIKVQKESLFFNSKENNNYHFPNKYESKTYFIDLDLPTLTFELVETGIQKSFVIQNNNNQVLMISDRMNGFQEVLEVLTNKWEVL